MKNNKALAIALSAGLVLTGAFALDTDNVAFAAEDDATSVEDKDLVTPTADGDKEEEKPAEGDKEEEKPADGDKEEEKPAEGDKEEKESKEWVKIEDIAKTIEDDSHIIVPIITAPKDEEEKDETALITSEEIDQLINDIDEKDAEILEEMKKVDSSIIEDENKKPSDENKDEETDAKPGKDKECNCKPCEEKVVVKEVIKDCDKAKAPAQAVAAHNNPKTGVAGLSAVAGTLAVSMAGIVATKKKED